MWDTDVAEGVFGYVSTPGGRVWLVDWRDATARQVCGVGAAFRRIRATTPAGRAASPGSIPREALAGRFRLLERIAFHPNSRDPLYPINFVCPGKLKTGSPLF